MLTKALALALGSHQIRVNAIVPGFIQTPGVQRRGELIGDVAGKSLEERQTEILARVPLGRMGEPDDIAWTALFLASAASDYMTGSTLLVDRGYLLS